MVNWWFGARWFLDSDWIPLWKGLFRIRVPLESQTTNPNHQFTISWYNLAHHKIPWTIVIINSETNMTLFEPSCLMMANPKFQANHKERQVSLKRAKSQPHLVNLKPHNRWASMVVEWDIPGCTYIHTTWMKSIKRILSTPKSPDIQATKLAKMMWLHVFDRYAKGREGSSLPFS